MVIREGVRRGIRKFRKEDLSDVIDINMTCLPEHYPPFFYLSLAESYPEAFLVAEVDTKVVGYIMCRVEMGFSSFGVLQGFARKGHIVSIAVRPEFRSIGVGMALVEETMKALKEYYNCAECYLEVRVSNQAAVALYEKLKYKKVRRLHSYYRDGEGAFLMSIRL